MVLADGDRNERKVQEFLILWAPLEGLELSLAQHSVTNQNNDCLVGFSQGNGAVDPGSIDFSASLPFTMGAGGIPLSLWAVNKYYMPLDQLLDKVIAKLGLTSVMDQVREALGM